VYSLNSNRQLTVLALSIFIGVAFPQLASWFKPFLLPTIFLMFTFAILQIRFADVIRYALRERSTWIILLWQLAVLPLIAAILLRPLLSDYFYLLAVVSLCAGAITATTALTRLFGLNDALAMVVGMLGTIAMPIPLYLFLNAGTALDANVELSVYINRIVIFIAVPFALVALIRWVINERTDAWIRQQMPVAVLILLTVFGLSVMDGVQALLLEQPLLLLQYVALAFCVSLVVQLVTFAALRFLGQRDAMTACMLSAYRNMGMVAAIAGASLGEHFFIYVGIWQLPMYTLPKILAGVYSMHSSGQS
jgi:BASS family bile acid:Na+ symporter